MTASTPDNLFRTYLRTGDPEAFAGLYDVVRPELLGVASRLAPNASLAEDLVQATFLGALEATPRFQRNSKVMPWLVGILKNQARLMRWREGRKPEADRLAWPEVTDPAEQAEDRELQSTLSKALSKLGAIYEPIMRSHLREQLSAQEIAERHARPAGTVRTQIVRGTAMLRNLLPAGLATMLFVRLTPGLRAADVRAELQLRAGDGVVQRSLLGTSTWKGVLFALGSAAALAITTLLALQAANDTSPPLGGVVASANEHPDLQDIDRTPTVLPTTEPTRALASRDHRAALEVVVKDAGKPLAGVPVHIQNFAELRFSRRMLCTDGDGRATFEGLMPGLYHVLPISTGAARDSGIVRLEPDATARRDVNLTDAITIRGRTVDPQGFAVANATIWLCDGNDQHGGLGSVPFATSDATGHFEVRCFERSEFRYLIASANGHVTSRAIYMPRAGSTDLLLEMPHGGGRVSGVVLDENGAPRHDTMVRIRHHGSHTELVDVTRNPEDPLGLRTLDSHHIVREVRTDAEGRFAVDGLQVGQMVRVTAWSPEHARCEQVVAVGSHGEWQLDRGATIRGRITAAGKPATFVEVSIEADGKDGRLRNVVGSNARGEFELCGLTPGQAVRIAAESAPDFGGLGKATANVMLDEAKVYEWNPKLETGDLMAGVLRSSDGTALADWRIGVTAVNVREGRSYFTLKTDAAGRFAVRGLPRSNYTFEPRPRRGATAQKFVATWPLQEDYELVIDAERAKAAEDENFSSYHPQRTDLPAGRLDITGIERGADIWFYVYYPDGRNAWVNVNWDNKRNLFTSTMQPGRYQLSISSNQWSTSELTTADHVLDFTIAGGSTTSLDVKLQPGVRRNFRIVEPSPFLGGESAEMAVTDLAGRVVARGHVPRWLDKTPTTFEATIALAPGRYRMEITTSIGQVGSREFAIHALQPNEVVLDLQVR